MRGNKSVRKSRAPSATRKERTSQVKVARAKAKPPAAKAAKGSVVDTLLARAVSITDAKRAALRGLFTDAQCEDWGKRTQGEGVRAEAEAWAPRIESALRAWPDAFETYTPARFRWFLECVHALEDALAEKRGKTGDATSAARKVERARVAGREVRRSLAGKLRTLAGGDAEAKAELADSAGVSHTEATLAQSLDGLAALAEAWLARTDETAVNLVPEVKLGADDVARAQDAAAALRGAKDGKTFEGAIASKDSPAVNVAEGRVLREMKVVMDAFEDARARQPRIERLVPGSATRHLLRHSTAASKSAANGGEADQGAPGAPAPVAKSVGA